MKKLFFLIGLLSFLLACGSPEQPVNNNKENEESNEIKNQDNKTSDFTKDTIPKEIKKRVQKKHNSRQIVSNDSTYQIQLFDQKGKITGSYDIWKNNPFEFPDFEKHNHSGDSHPMYYKVPKLTKKDLKNKIPQDLYNSLPGNVSIGKLAIYPYISEGSNYVAILYHLFALEGYSEEYDFPATFGLIKVISNDGKIIKELEVANSAGGDIAVSQDGKYLVCRIATENEGGAFEVYNLRNERVVFSKKVGRGFELHGPALHPNNVIGLSANGLSSSIFISFNLLSDREIIFIKEFSGIRRNYTFEDIEEGIVLQHRTNKTIDTLLFNRDFQQIKI